MLENGGNMIESVSRRVLTATTTQRLSLPALPPYDAPLNIPTLPPLSMALTQPPKAEAGSTLTKKEKDPTNVIQISN
jgi:hypothetical protein